MGGSEKWSKDGASNLPPFLSKKVLKPFITAELSVPLSSPIEFRPLHGGRTAFGVPATLLPDICDVWLKAREAGILKEGDKNFEIAAKAEILMRGFAHVGNQSLPILSRRKMGN